MILLWFVLLPLIGGVVAWRVERLDPAVSRWTALIVLAVLFGLALGMWLEQREYAQMGLLAPEGMWLVELERPWVPSLGIGFHLAMDGLSLLMVLLTLLLGIMAVAASWTEIRERAGFFHLQLLFMLAGINGVFLAMDLFLFYFFWELMLVPMFLIIDIWGHERRRYAAVKFFIITQVSGLLMLVSILGLYFVHAGATGAYTFDYPRLLGAPAGGVSGFWLMMGFLIAFAVKLPVIPFHTWLPDAHTEAPTAGSVILAGLLLKTGAYGMIRFIFPLFPDAASAVAPVAMALGVFGILYGAVLAFAQSDLKRLVAYTSVSHMGFVLLGLFAGNTLALQGAVMEMICHGIATGALFILVGALQERLHTREMGRMGGLWAAAPRMGAAALFFALALLGLPGLGNFIGEFLVLLGAYRVNYAVTAVAAVGLVTAAVYALWMLQRVFQGPNLHERKIPDLDFRETAVMSVMIVLLVWLGMYPQPVFDMTGGLFEDMRKGIAQEEQGMSYASAPGDAADERR